MPPGSNHGKQLTRRRVVASSLLTRRRVDRCAILIQQKATYIDTRIHPSTIGSHFPKKQSASGVRGRNGMRKGMDERSHGKGVRASMRASEVVHATMRAFWQTSFTFFSVNRMLHHAAQGLANRKAIHAVVRAAYVMHSCVCHAKRLMLLDGGMTRRPFPERMRVSMHRT